MLLQSCWNFERMQNIGFALCMEPWLRRLHPHGGARAREARRRHLGYFNTQPYMAGFVLGVTGRLEEELADASKERRERIAQLKRALETSLAGLGDALFWGTLQPLCAATALAVGWTLHAAAGAAPAAALSAGLAVYLLSFNGPALWLRWQGIRLGYELGDVVVVKLRRMHWQRRIRHLRAGGLLLTAVLAGGHLVGQLLQNGPGVPHMNAGYAAALAFCLGLKLLRVRTLPAYGLLAAGGLLLSPWWAQG